MQIENAFKDPENRFWEKNSSESIVGNSEVQSNPAISNSVNSKSPLALFRSNHQLNRSFPTPLINQPRYFELVNNRVQEETPKRPTKSEVRRRLTIQFVCC